MLQNLISEQYKAEAKSWLIKAQNPGSNSVGCIEEMRNHLTSGNWTLADIGTSEEKLGALLEKVSA